MNMQTVIVKSLLLATLALATAAQAQAQAQNQQTNVAAPDREGYRVNAGDRLEVSVWKEPDLQREVLVRPDGAFSFPLAGEVVAEGRTVGEIREELESRLARFIPDLVSTVTVVSVEGNSIFVIGQVNNPGTFIMNPVLDVMQALSLAGGTTPFAALKDIRILRRESGTQRALRFDYNAVAEGRSLELNVQLRSGDVVVVP
jgi:polysaccharide biosynthesis/export protein